MLINVCIIEAESMVGATPQKHNKLSICCRTLEAIACLDFKRSKSKIYDTLNELLKMVKVNAYRSEAGDVVGTIPHKSIYKTQV